MVKAFKTKLLRIKGIDFVFVEAQVGTAVFHIVFGIFSNAGDLVVGQAAGLACRISHVEPAAFEGFPGWDQRSGGDDHVAVHNGLVENGCVDSNEHPVVNSAPVNHGIVADGDLIADDGRSVGVHHMNAGIVLHVASVADANVVHVTADGDVEPDAGFGSKHHIADDIGARGDEIGGVDLWLLVDELV